MELYGRRVITSKYREVTRDNLLEILSNAYDTHALNRAEEQYLFDYYRGKQEIRFKTKDTRPEINHKVTENRCLAITDFKTGYIAGDPIVYTSRSQKPENGDKVALLNTMMLYENKEASDKELFDWMHITGHGYRLVLPDGDFAPFSLTVLKPMNTFVIYDNTVRQKPIAAVTYVVDDTEKVFSIYTPTKFFVVRENKIEDERDNFSGIPIIEYRLNQAMVGAFEPVIPLLDAINYLDSDRLDGVTTFINSLCVLYNAELPEGEDGNTIRQKGLITLKSIGENKADIKILSEQLDQTSVQSLKEDLYQSVLQIVGMPNQSGTGSESSNNGAMYLKQGYQLAETRAKDTELMFKKSERECLKLVLNCILTENIELSDIDITFTRRAYSDINSKANVLSIMLNNEKVNPIDAWMLSGITPEPEEACRRGLEWYEKQVIATDRRDKSADNESDGAET